MAYWALLSLAGPCCKVCGLLRWCASFLLERPFFSFDREIDGSMWAGFTHARAVVGCSFEPSRLMPDATLARNISY